MAIKIVRNNIILFDILQFYLIDLECMNAYNHLLSHGFHNIMVTMLRNIQGSHLKFTSQQITDQTYLDSLIKDKNILNNSKNLCMKI
jgi:hypothetical protein